MLKNHLKDNKGISSVPFRLRNPLKKRALATAGVFFAMGIWIANQMTKNTGMAVVGIASVITVTLLWRKKRWVATVLLTFALGIVFLNFREQQMPKTAPEGTGVLTGRVCSQPKRGDTSLSLLLDKVQWNGQSTQTKLRLYVTVDDGVQIRYGDIVSVEEAKLAIPSVKRNPGGNDSRLYAWSMGAGLQSSARQISVTGHQISLFERIYVVRERMEAAMQSVMAPDQFGIIKGMLFGDTADMEEQWVDSFQAAGLAHLLAVSGSHVGIIALALDWLFKRLPIKRIGFLLTIVLLLLYGVMAGLTQSVVRSIIMSVFLLSGNQLGEKNDTLNSLGGSAIVILLFNPFQIFSAGMILSFSAVLGILFFYQPIVRLLVRTRWKSRLWVWIRANIALTVSAQLGVLPAQLAYFGTLPLLTVLANLVVMPFVNISAIAAFMAAILGLIHTLLALLPAQIAGLAGSAMQKVAQVSAQIPGAVSTVGALHWWGYLAVAILFVGIWKYTEKVRTRLICLGVSIFIFVGGLLGNYLLYQNRLMMTFLDVGQGDSTFIRQGQTCILLDAGDLKDGVDYGKNVVVPFLRHQGISKLDAIIISHPDSDHFGGFLAVVDEVEVGLIITGPDEGADDTLYAQLIQKIEEKSIPHYILQTGDTMQIGSADVEVLHPDGWQGDSNESSLIMTISYGSQTILFTGDAGFPSEESVLPVISKVDVLKVGHHGSKYATGEAFAQAIHPTWSIISVGNNPHGHPAERVIDTLQQAGSKIITTQEYGAITVTCVNHDIKVRTMKTPSNDK